MQGGDPYGVPGITGEWSELFKTVAPDHERSCDRWELCGLPSVGSSVESSCRSCSIGSQTLRDRMHSPDGIGLKPGAPEALHRHLNLKLAELGFAPVPPPGGGVALDATLEQFIAHGREKDRLLTAYLCPADNRIQTFLYDYLGDIVVPPRLPAKTLVLDRPGLARMLSLPPGENHVSSPLLKSYRLRNGVLHNPKSDRRTTAGIFHVTEGGLPIPDDKKAVPREAFAALLRRALQPPSELQRLPFTAGTVPADCFVSMQIRPVVSPEVPGFQPKKSMEIRFLVPGSLVANLDFVESIFGNGGDPYLPENDAALDVEHWSGQTGCVILAPHITGIPKQQLGLPRWEDATERQRRDGMCWKTPDELYNEGNAFKLTARDASGTIVTLISDNYFGYCKKEVKTQVSFAANLLGLAEEEHAGGALVFARYDLASEYDANQHRGEYPHTFEEAMRLLGATVEVHPEGYGVDRAYPHIVYVPETVQFELELQTVRWTRADGGEGQLKLLLGNTYVLPSGFRVHLEKPQGNRAWRLVGTRPEAVLCHKPCTVSGGGKSEISKPIADAIIHGPVFVADFHHDFDAIEEVLKHDFSDRFRDPARAGQDHRPLLSPQRTLGSVIKVLTPSNEFSDAHNAWLGSIPAHIKELVLVVKRFWKPGWGEQWREQFSVDVINGTPANELRLGRRRLATQFLRVGYAADGAWRTFGLRKDFHPSLKLQAEDDITASIIVPRARAGQVGEFSTQPSVKFVQNVEYRLFQRPDDAVVRGYDQAAEADFGGSDNFFSNYEPMTRADARNMVEESVGFYQFTEPMQRLVSAVADSRHEEYFVSTSNPRIVDGKPSKNPRYLQTRPDLLHPQVWYLAQVGARLARRLSTEVPLPVPVHAVLAGRRNNPAEKGVRSLACYGPVHYLELPELFMEFISSMTGKSPSTTGAGSEGALTKSPFNSLPPVYDLNAALVGFIVTGYDGFLTSAGCVGPKLRVDHDISLLVPELWCRMGVEERAPHSLIANGYLERCQDVQIGGKLVRASRLGYRITPRFVSSFFGRVFNHPHSVLTEPMLRPEQQDANEFADAVANILETHRRVAEHYFNDGSIDAACPPLRALLHIMRGDAFEGQGLDSPALRELFTRENMLASDWYRERLKAKQTIDLRLWRRHSDYIEKFLGRPGYSDEAVRLGVRDRLHLARVMVEKVKSPAYLDELIGTIGAEPAIADAVRKLG